MAREATTEVVQIRANVEWRWLRGSGGNYVAVCDPLKITLQAETWTDLIEDMNISLNALVLDLIESNEWEKFMREHGWLIVGQMPARLQNARFEVPFSILPFSGAQHEHGSARSLSQ